ncbi:ribonuclease Z [Butyrivibrio sp. MB2005]|uniref:ribonuclease Z n=1 Tax=Butyrivibrio sp. MB2005 TaxID=1280678 RepID=UPI000424D3BF|nr:ribonuclease Z [Butyrivibrio sp. MB2005]
MIDVCLLGTGGMMPLPNRFLTALMVRYNGKSILVDCGEGTQIALRKSGWSPKPIDVICFTHYHADHISGLPGMLLTMGNAERTEPLLLVGPKGLQRVVKALRTIAPELPFEIQYHEIEGDSDEFTLPGMNEFRIKAFKVNHNILCYGYTMHLDRIGKFDVERAKASGIEMKFWNRLQKGETITTDDGKVFTPDMVLGEQRKGIHLTYVTDSRPTDSIAENAEGSDLFICEGMYGEEDKLQKARENKHMTMYEAAELAKKAKVEQMWLTHYSPSLVNPKEYLPKVQDIFKNSVATKDGRVITLRFEED